MQSAPGIPSPYSTVLPPVSAGLYPHINPRLGKCIQRAYAPVAPMCQNIVNGTLIMRSVFLHLLFILQKRLNPGFTLLCVAAGIAAIFAPATKNCSEWHPHACKVAALVQETNENRILKKKKICNFHVAAFFLRKCGHCSPFISGGYNACISPQKIKNVAAGKLHFFGEGDIRVVPAHAWGCHLESFPQSSSSLLQTWPQTRRGVNLGLGNNKNTI